MTCGSIINNDFNTCSVGQLLAAGLASCRFVGPSPSRSAFVWTDLGSRRAETGLRDRNVASPLSGAACGAERKSISRALNNGRFYNMR